MYNCKKRMPCFSQPEPERQISNGETYVTLHGKYKGSHKRTHTQSSRGWQEDPRQYRTADVEAAIKYRKCSEAIGGERAETIHEGGGRGAYNRRRKFGRASEGDARNNIGMRR
jgi:hypothetical protein